MLLQSEIAGLGRRLAGTALDLVVLNLINIPFVSTLRDYAYSPLTIFAVNFALMIVYNVLMLVARGQTLGHLLMGIRVIAAAEGGIAPGQAISRSLVKWTPVFGVFILQAIVDPNPMLLLSEGDAPAMADGNFLSEAIFLFGMILWIGLLLFARRHPDGQGLHDRAAGTYVIQTP